MPIENFKLVHTREELDNRIDNHRKKLGMSTYDVWFRGQSKVSHNLTPGLFRKERYKWEVEHNIYADFLTYGKRFLPKDSTSWEVLSTMQHWGAPTRALDWTTSLNTALFFALCGEIDNPVIWMINPYEINEKSVDRRVIFDELDTIHYEYIDALSGNNVKHELPIALSIAWVNERIERQAGLFTIHGLDHSPINEQRAIKSSVKHVVLSNQLANELRKDLLKNGITPFTMFPDLGGVCATLQWKHGYI